jgi:hypothetical protein
MTPERRERILQIADDLEAEGLEATNSAVYSRALGHRGDVVQTMKERRAERNGNGNVTVLDAEPEDSPTASELQDDLTQLEQSYDAWHLALERLWEIEQEGPLSEQNFSRKQWLEYNMVQNLQAQERVRPQLEAVRRTEAVHAAQQAHDDMVPVVSAQAEAVVQALAQLGAALQALAQGFTAQVDGLATLRDRHGMQAFDVVGGYADVVQFLQLCFPSDYRAKEVADLLVGSPLLRGNAQAALANSPRLKPFAIRAVENYLTTMEGVTHANT